MLYYISVQDCLMYSCVYSKVCNIRSDDLRLPSLKGDIVLLFLVLCVCTFAYRYELSFVSSPLGRRERAAASEVVRADASTSVGPTVEPALVADPVARVASSTMGPLSC